MTSDNYFIPHLEWESDSFPLTITKLACSESLFGFASNSKVIVERADNFKLTGKITGTVLQPSDLKEDNFTGKGNIIEGKNLTGEDSEGNIIELTNCHLISYHTNSWNKTENGYLFEGDFIADKFTIIYKQKLGINKRFDWFVCSKPKVHFWETTIRRSVPEKIKIRRGIDTHTEDEEMKAGVSWAKDYVKVDLTDFSFIIAKVPVKICSNSLHGLCFEFRDIDNFKIPDEGIIKQIKSFVSFLFGNKLSHIGYSLTSDNDIQKSVYYSVNSESLRLSSQTPMPPVTFNTKYEWGDFSWLVNKLLPQYLNINGELKLGQAISRYWISKGLAIGVNLPTLANAVEIITAEYLMQKGEFKTEIIPDEEYLKLIDDELEKLQSKLLAYPEGQIILNNIKKGNKKSINVKMNTFFKLIGIDIGKEEKAAIQLRNKMTHSTRDYSKDEKAYDDLVLTRVYEVLFNRIILKLLGYDDYYTDYSIQNAPLKHISASAGSQ